MSNLIIGQSKFPTVSEAGYLTYRCTKCSKEIVVNYPILNSSNYTVKHKEEPTCSETGLDSYTYNGSDAYPYTFNVEVPVVDHDYVDGVCRFCGQAQPCESVSWTLDDGTLTIAGNGEMPSYSSGEAPWYDCRSSITRIVVGDGITGIGDYAFYNCNKATSVVLPNSLTSIGNHAFSGCRSLPNITFPAGVNSIEAWAFSNCTSLTSVVLPAGAAIKQYAFYGCSGLSHVTIPANTTSFGGCVFQNCSNLKTAGPIGGGYNVEFGWTDSIPADVFWCSCLEQVLIPDGMSSIGQCAFIDCNLQHLTIPSGLNTIGTSAFQGNNSLKTAGPIGGNYDIEYGWTDSIPDSAFNGCTALESVSFPAALTAIGMDAFKGTALSSISLPDSLSRIGSSAFRACRSLTHAALPGSLTSVPIYLFYQCSALLSVSIPSSVTSIKGGAFDECTSLETVYYAGSETQWGSLNISTLNNTSLLEANMVYNTYVP